MAFDFSVEQSEVRSSNQSTHKRTRLSDVAHAAYPPRPNFFAMRVLQKLLHHSIGQDIGIEACWLIVCIAVREDSLGYSQPLKFWNSQLQEMTGFGSWGRLDRARQRAVQAGWLHYQPGENRKIGVYWTTVPSGLDGDVKAGSSATQNRIRHHNNSQNGDQNGEPSISDDEPEREVFHPSRNICAHAIPTLEQVTAYAAELGYSTTQAASIFDHYQSCNWQTERGPVANWKSLVAKCLATAVYNSIQQKTARPKADAIQVWERLLSLLGSLGPYNDSHAAIRDQIGDVAWQAARSLGLSRIDSATEFELRKLRQTFLSAIEKVGRES